ncbi:hypothetical protein ACIA74_36170 [Streptomyces sp. NPDC051658]|uniref:hypothetical protein n=1 Tax=Streptomyces sp. NPDC051658 TaxID=3365667 RepID=UPI003794A612
MSEATVGQRPPEPDWLAMTTQDLVANRGAENRFRVSSAARRTASGRPVRRDAPPVRAIPLPAIRERRSPHTAARRRASNRTDRV